MKLNEYFQPIHVKKDLLPTVYSTDSWIHKLAVYQKNFPSFDGKTIALIGIEDGQTKSNINYIRSFLYNLKRNKFAETIVDLGNYIFDEKDEKSFEKLGYVLSELTEKKIIPVIIGGSQELTYSQYLSFEYLKKIINIVSIDSRIDFDIDNKENYVTKNFWYKILLRDPSYLFSLSQVAYQSYLTDTNTIKLMEKNFFELYRLGKVRENIMDVEPVIRGTDLLTFDISAIKQSDSPGSKDPSPNGLYADEACQLTRFAGLSDNLKTIGFYNYDAASDINYQSARLIAQLIWHFVDGVMHRDIENISGDNANFVKYITTDSSNDYQIVFFKSKKTNRWWMEIPENPKSKHFNKFKQIIPCAYRDYQQATRGEIPERWCKSLKRMF